MSKIKKFNKFLRKYKISKEQCIFITDTLGDILESNKVGIPSIGVSWGYHNKETLKKGSPIFIADTIEELSNFLL